MFWLIPIRNLCPSQSQFYASFDFSEGLEQQHPYRWQPGRGSGSAVNASECATKSKQYSAVIWILVTQFKSSLVGYKVHRVTLADVRINYIHLKNIFFNWKVPCPYLIMILISSIDTIILIKDWRKGCLNFFQYLIFNSSWSVKRSMFEGKVQPT